MTANPTLLQMKYARVVGIFAQRAALPLDDALAFFYHSDLYPLLREGVADLHCMSDGYLVEELKDEFFKKQEV